MLLTCVSDSAKTLPETYHSKLVPSGDRNMRYSLEIGKQYVAGAFGVFMGCTVFLVKTERGDSPEWAPAPLFEVADGRISRQWHFWDNPNHSEYVFECVVGYAELTDGSDHLDALVDSDPYAVSLFNIRLQEIENELRL